MALEYNKAVLETLEEGDGVEFPRGPFSHFGVYVGEGNVVHKGGVKASATAADSSASKMFTTSGSGMDKACIKVENACDVAGESKMIKNNSKDARTPPLPREEIKDRALDSVGPTSYNALFDNCEHFVNSCRSGVRKSDQADTALTWILALGALATVGGIAYNYWFGKEDKKKEKHSQN